MHNPEKHKLSQSPKLLHNKTKEKSGDIQWLRQTTYVVVLQLSLLLLLTNFSSAQFLPYFVRRISSFVRQNLMIVFGVVMNYMLVKWFVGQILLFGWTVAVMRMM